MSIVERSLARKIMEFGCRIASIFNPIIPKSKSKILFYESTPDFMNNYELMRYMVHKGYDQKYELYYFPDIREECQLNKKYKNVKFSNSLIKAFFLFLITRVVFLDTGNMRMKPSKKQSVVYMDHGLPFKWAGKAKLGTKSTIPDDMTMPVNFFPSSSENYDKMYCNAYGLRPEQLMRCGRPRTDAFYKSEKYLDRIGIDKTKYSKIIMWMTTYRVPKNMRGINTPDDKWSQTEIPLLTDMRKIQEINDFLKGKNYLLTIKIHASSVFNEQSIQELSNVRLLQDKDFINKGIQIYDILKDFDCLVTDYSSVFLDYSITEKPVIFVTDDFEEFKKLRGFFFDDPLAFMPGPKVNTYDELTEQLSKIDENEKDYAKKRKYVKNFCHHYQDGKDSERILNLLGVSLK